MFGRETNTRSSLSRRDFVRATGLGVAALAAGAGRGPQPVFGGRPQDGLLVRGGTIVTAEDRFRGDVRVRGEKIVEVGPGLAPAGERVIDAEGTLVLPGGIDPHAHLTQAEGGPEKYRYGDDLTSGSEAALAGGVTTIGNMTVPGQGQTVFDALERDARFVAEKAIADIVLHPVLLDPSELGEQGIRELADAGNTTVKIFMVIASFDQHLREYVRVMRMAGEVGILSLVHCEDPAIIAEATHKLVAAGKSSLRYYSGSRPLSCEVIATQRAIAYCEITGAPIYVVHLSAAEPLRICRDAQSQGLPVYVETRPIYLHFSEERYERADGPLYVGQPPLRTPEDVEALWAGMKDGSIHTLGTDHVGWSKGQKMDPELSIEDLRPGVPNLQEMFPVLYSEGVVKERISLQRFVEIIAANPARLLGLYPRKGTIAVGSDADLALWDPNETRKIELADLRSRCGFSLFEGWEVTGWPRMTIRRGAVVYEDGEIKARPGTGQVLSCGSTQSL
jgi:dihydropyrimidinase